MAITHTTLTNEQAVDLMAEYWDLQVALDSTDPAVGATPALTKGLRRMTAICVALKGLGYCSVEENRRLRANHGQSPAPVPAGAG